MNIENASRLCAELHKPMGNEIYGQPRNKHLADWVWENIVKQMFDEGQTVDEISKKLGMSKEEIFRLSKLDRDTFLELVTKRQTFSKAKVIKSY